MARLIALITCCCAGLIGAAESQLPDRAARALADFRQFETEQAVEAAEFAAEQAEDRARYEARTVAALKRALTSRSSVDEQAAVYRAIMAIDDTDADARAFFEVTGTLDQILAEVQVQASQASASTDLLAAATAAAAEPLAVGLPETAFSASTHWSAPLAASSARFSHADGWAVGQVDSDPWLQVDLGANREIVAVGTLGRGQANQYVTAYLLSFSRDGETWVPLPGPDGEPREFDGNVQRDVEVRHDLPQPVVARYVRFHPLRWRGHRSMRVEVYGR